MTSPVTTEGAGRLRRDAERNRDRILAAARRLFAETGQAVTHNEVARAADVGVGTVYRRFPERADLMRALFEDQLEQVGALADAALAEPDPWPALRGFFERVVDLQAADRGLREFMLGPDGRARAGEASARGVSRSRYRSAMTPWTIALSRPARSSASGVGIASASRRSCGSPAAR